MSRKGSIVVGADLSKVSQLLDAPIRELDEGLLTHAALVVTSYATDVEDARDLLSVIGLYSQEIHEDQGPSQPDAGDGSGNVLSGSLTSERDFN